MVTTWAALPDLLTGRLPLYIASSAELLGPHKSGGVHIVATAGDVRSPFLSDIPTLKESGVDIEAPGWFAFYAPARTPPEVLDRLERAISAAARAPDVPSKIASVGFQATDTSARDLRRIQRAEFDAWKAVVTTSGFKAD